MNGNLNQDATVPFWFPDFFRCLAVVPSGLLVSSLLNWIFVNYRHGKDIDSIFQLFEIWLRTKWQASVIVIMVFLLSLLTTPNAMTAPVLLMATIIVAFFSTYKNYVSVPIEMLRLQEDRIGRSFAWWYYVNYLLNTLPGLRTRIEDLEYDYNIKIPVKKLFILIPCSGKISSLLCDIDKYVAKCNHDNLDAANHKFKERNIFNTVYNILPEAERDMEYLCIVEFCTPVYTLHEMNRDSFVTGMSDKLLEGTVKVFYKTLLNILAKCHECQSSYELILYDDIENYTMHKISREIRSAILRQNEGNTLFRKTKII